MKMLRPLQPLVVAQGTSGAVVQSIMEAVHEVQLARHLQPPDALKPQQMQRSAQ